ncbi:MAG: CDP-alcohol phosphatidyltransferase family protein [Actinomycetota bacterium]
MSKNEIEEAPLVGPFSVPNAITALRLALLPVFLIMVLRDQRYVAGGYLLAILGITDYLDGWIARRFKQTSNLGKILDPIADRLLAFAGLFALWVSHCAPRWLLLAIALRELLVSVAVVFLAAIGAARIDVLWVGKAGTFALMFAFPGFLFGMASGGVGTCFYVLAYIFGLIGLLLSWVALGSYVQPALDALRRGRKASQS